jgi:ring-1,2-phenylacetyl-CoA epoxidase subunit PaaD
MHETTTGHHAPTYSETQVWEWLEEVKDPEIPAVSLVQLGVIDRVSVLADGTVEVDMIPTFTGCPAIDFMRLNAQECLYGHGVRRAEVKILKTAAWSSERITEAGRKKLLEFGLSPPPRFTPEADPVLNPEPAECPHCGSFNTQLRTPFGPTLCRAIHSCHSCGETFEQFKPL